MFNADYADMQTFLTSNGVSFKAEFNDLSADTSKHSWTSGWVPAVLNDLAAL